MENGNLHSEIPDKIVELIKKRESGSVEFKSSFRYDTKLKISRPQVLEKMIAKALGAFMNAEGGRLFIGIDDEGNILGLEDDYKTLKEEKQNSDEFEIELRQSVEKYTKDKVANENFKVNFRKVHDKEIYDVVIYASSQPIIIHDGGKQEFYVRVGNSSRPYSWEEFYDYTNRRFRK